MLLLIWAGEKYNTQKNPCVVFATQKNPGVFHRPKKNPFWPKCQTQKSPSTPPSLKYVSGAPGHETSTLYNMIATTCSVQRKQCPIAHGTSGFCYQTSEYSVKFFGGKFKLKMHCNQCSSKKFFQAGCMTFGLEHISYILPEIWQPVKLTSFQFALCVCIGGPTWNYAYHMGSSYNEQNSCSC